MPEFIPLHHALRAEPGPPIVVEPNEEPSGVASSSAVVDGDLAETLGAVRRFRAAVADAADYAVQELLKDVAAHVLARELTVAPADLAAIVLRARTHLGRENILTVRAHPSETDALSRLDVNVFADPTLQLGDVAIDLRGGTIDLSLSVRLEAVLLPHGA